MELPTLYTLTGLGYTRYWKISVLTEADKVYTCREYGKYKGKPIINKKLVETAKSRSTVYEQAIFEAEKEWKEKKDKKGYVTDLNILTNSSSQLSNGYSFQLSPTPITNEGKMKLLGELRSPIPPSSSGEICPPKIQIAFKSGMTPHVTEIRKGGMGGICPPSCPPSCPPTTFKFLPMLANKFSERKGYVQYPCLVQHKLDGVRYTAHKVAPTIVVLKTRSDADCPFFNEIKSALLQLKMDPNILLDGEFYSKKVPFHTLNGYCNRKKLDGKTGYNTIPKENLESIHYYIFDCYFVKEPNKPFDERHAYITQLLSTNTSEYLHLVPVTVVNQESEILPLHDQFVTEGYEGIMIRNAKSAYKLKDRSNDLLKYKNFLDAEFIIVGAEAPTTGKEEGCIIWILKVPDSQETFTCRPSDSYNDRQAEYQMYLEDPKQYIGKKYCVRYQELYDNGTPRFGVGQGIRYDV